MSNNLHIEDPRALRYFMNDDLYLIAEAESNVLQADQSLQPVAVVIDEKPHFEYLGENNRYTLILVSHPKAIPEKEKELLTKTLSALKYELRDVAVLNIARYPQAGYAELAEFFRPGKIISFGADLSRLSSELHLMQHQILQHQATRLLLTADLDTLAQTPSLKKEWWDKMKELFS